MAYNSKRELRAKGYKGSERAVYRYLETLEPSDLSVHKYRPAVALEQSASPREPNPPFDPLSTTSDLALFPQARGFKGGRIGVSSIVEAGQPTTVEATYQLVDTFLHMVRERTGEQLDTWLGAVSSESSQRHFSPL